MFRASDVDGPAQSAAVAAYNYDELDASRGEIRLLTFSWAGIATDESEPLSCSMSKWPLDEAPVYSAISYAWGEAESWRGIRISGDEVKVPAQAEEALRCLLLGVTKTRDDGNDNSTIHMWIDALCINQADTDERSRQVAIMSNIYASAYQVLVYLGRPFDGHVETMQAITDAFSQLREMYSDSAELGLALELDTELPDLQWPSDLTEERLTAFYSSRWFTRLWVLQEVTLSKKAIAFCGRESIMLMDAILLAQWIAKRDYQAGSFRNRTLSLLARSIEYARTLHGMRCSSDCPYDHQLGECRPGICYPGLHLDDLLRDTHDHLNSEPRDKVYAIMGLCNIDVASRIKPDYSLPLSTVYTQAARLACSEVGEDHSLDIMRLARVLGNKPTHWYKQNNWPTWVPLWHEVYNPLVNPSGFPWWMFNAAWSTTPDLTPAPLGNPVLRCEGVVVDEVEYVSRPFVPLSDHETTDDLRADFENAVRELSPLAAKALTPNGQSYTTALGLTLACGYYPFMQSEYSLGETHFGAALQDTSLRSLTALLSQSARDNLEEGLGDEARYLLQFQIHTRFRSVFFTKRGYMGLGSQHMMVDDVVCIPFGSDAPWVLREEGGHYVFLGPCYVHGIMGGEFMRAAGGDLVRSFEIH